MKKTLTVITLLAGAIGVQAQGQIQWDDNIAGSSPYTISIWSPSTTPGQIVGNTSYDNPAGPVPGAVYPGSVALGGSTTGSGPTAYGNGNNFEVGLYLDTSTAAVKADVLNGSPVAVSGIGTTTAGTGYYSLVPIIATASAATFSGTALPGGTQVYVEIAAWYIGANSGGPTSYAAAITDGDLHGTDLPSTATVGLAVAPSPLNNLGALGLQSFDLISAVPEPSTIALGVMGASALLFRRRK